MKEIKIPKRNGQFRVVVAPDPREKAACKSLLGPLTAIAMLLDVHNVSHGFMPGRSPVTNAMRHVGYRWTLSADLENCFDHVTRQLVERAAGGLQSTLVKKVEKACFVNEIARQGLPTSPALCNIALAPMDSEIVRLLNGRGVYTRYADDLSISTNDFAVIAEMRTAIPSVVARYGQQLSVSKTRIQCADAGRRIITGVAVDADGIHPTRKMKRRLRAAKHQHKTIKARGLSEWCKLKPPDVLKVLNKAEKFLQKNNANITRQLAQMMIYKACQG